MEFYVFAKILKLTLGVQESQIKKLLSIFIIDTFSQCRNQGIETYKDLTLL